MSELKKQITKASFNPKIGLDTSKMVLPNRPQVITTVDVLSGNTFVIGENNRWPSFYNKFHHNIYDNKTLLKFLKER